MRVQGSGRVGIRHFGFSEDKGTVASETTISRIAISRQLKSWAPEGGIGARCHQSSGIGDSEGDEFCADR
jgi:hypothetical protein